MALFRKDAKPESAPLAAPPQPSKPIFANEVFTPSVPASRGFVGRHQEMEDLRKKGLSVPGTQIVVWGESGAGKSSLVGKVLEESGLTAVKTACTPDSTYLDILAAAFAGTGAFYIAETNVHDDVTLGTSLMLGSDLIGAKVQGQFEWENGKAVTREPLVRPQLTPQRLVAELGARSLSWVIEDFHKMPAAERLSVAHALKVFSDEGARYPDTRVIVLGVSDSVEELVDPPANVGKRLIDIPVPPLDAGELGKILDTGERLLNLDFAAVRGKLLETSVGTASITHALALACCDEREIDEAQVERVAFTHHDLENAVASYARTRSSSLKSRFRKALVVHRQRKYKNTELILRALANLPESGGTLADILVMIRQDSPQTLSYPYANLTKYLDELQREDRGALVRKTSAGTYRFDEPLQHAFAKGYFQAAGEATTPDVTVRPVSTGSFDALSQWERVIVSAPLGIRVDYKLLVDEIDAEIANFDEDEDEDEDES